MTSTTQNNERTTPNNNDRAMGSRHDGTTKQTASWQCNKNNPIGGSCTAGDSIVKSNSTTGAFNHQSPTTRMTRTTQKNNDRAINHPTKMKWRPWPGPPSQYLQMTITPSSPVQPSSLPRQVLSFLPQPTHPLLVSSTTIKTIDTTLHSFAKK